MQCRKQGAAAPLLYTNPLGGGPLSNQVGEGVGGEAVFDISPQHNLIIFSKYIALPWATRRLAPTKSTWTDHYP